MIPPAVAAASAQLVTAVAKAGMEVASAPTRALGGRLTVTLAEKLLGGEGGGGGVGDGGGGGEGDGGGAGEGGGEGGGGGGGDGGGGGLTGWMAL